MHGHNIALVQEKQPETHTQKKPKQNKQPKLYLFREKYQATKTVFAKSFVS